MQFDLITLWTDDVPAMRDFYHDVLGLDVEVDLGFYVGFKSEHIAFAVCARSVMQAVVGHPSYRDAVRGQSFQLSFPLDQPADVDRVYEEIIAKGARPLQGPADMPWNQRAAFFVDPEGNIHELYAELEELPTDAS